jgi:hypothetical protein
MFDKARRSWEDGMRIDLREIGSGGVVWTGLDWIMIGTGGGLL